MNVSRTALLTSILALTAWVGLGLVLVQAEEPKTGAAPGAPGGLLIAMPPSDGGAQRASAQIQAATPAPMVDARARTAERLVAVLDYVASDYAGAVSDLGQVTDADEYEEQIRMAASALAYSEELPLVPRGLVLAVEDGVKAKLSGAEIARRCAAVRTRAAEKYAVVMAPAVLPSLERAKEIYASSCITCHGASGAGDGPRAVSLNPAPANLLDRERMAAVTPYRVYCDVTYGIAGTAMPAILNPAADRWSVGFHAMSLRHEKTLAAARAAGPLPAPAPGVEAPRVGLATLAGSTDAELLALLAPAFPDEKAREVELARLRVEVPFDAAIAESPAALARRMITLAVEASRRGDRAEAHRLVLDGYLRGVEELEAPLATVDASLVVAIEDGVRELQAAIGASANGPDAEALVERRAGELLALLGRAEKATDTTRTGAALLAVAAAVMVLREGLEAALIVAAILALVRRTGLPAAAHRAVHGGWISALLAGVATFVLARTALSQLALSRELVEAIVSLLAAVVLFWTSFWLISKADGKRWLAYVKARAAGSAATGGAAGLFTVAFLATYREVFESVLFFEALLGGVASRAMPLALGAAAGAVLLAGAVWAIGFLEKRLPIGPFFAASGALLSALAVVLLGHGVHALQASALVLPRPVAFVRIDWLGVYPDMLSLGAQAALLIAIAGSTALVLRSAASEQGAQAA